MYFVRFVPFVETTAYAYSRCLPHRQSDADFINANGDSLSQRYQLHLIVYFIVSTFVEFNINIR